MGICALCGRKPEELNSDDEAVSFRANFAQNDVRQLFKIDGAGRMELGPNVTPSEAAQEFVRLVNDALGASVDRQVARLQAAWARREDAP